MEVKFEIIKGMEGVWFPQFTIGVQKFTLSPKDDEGTAKWYIGCLQAAFENLKKSYIENIQGDDNRTA